MSINLVTDIVSKRFLSKDTFLLNVNFPEKPNPGQFVMLSMVDGRSDPFLPRPISVFDWDDGVLSLLIKVVGRGTLLLSEMEKGNKIRVVGHLGNSFPDAKKSVFFVGGGIGVAPLLYAAKNSNAQKKTFFLGFKEKDSVAAVEFFEKYGNVILCTDDGSAGIKGFPHQMLKSELENGNIPELICTCGPEIMMESVHKTASIYKDIEIFHSFESKMGCGIGACLGCRIETKGGSYLVCKEGPVFNGKNIF
ncbi:MAG: dihydroorotate dehydrogenase electron transfer subunit [bacterium]